MGIAMTTAEKIEREIQRTKDDIAGLRIMVNPTALVSQSLFYLNKELAHLTLIQTMRELLKNMYEHSKKHDLDGIMDLIEPALKSCDETFRGIEG